MSDEVLLFFPREEGSSNGARRNHRTRDSSATKTTKQGKSQYFREEGSSFEDEPRRSGFRKSASDSALSNPPAKTHLWKKGLSPPLWIGGGLQSRTQEWEIRVSDPWVVQIAKEEYSVPFLFPPPLSPEPIHLPSYASQSTKRVAVREEVIKFLLKSALEPAPTSPGFYSRLFVVMKSSGDWRPAINLSRLN